jgi:hypothetical protein
MIFNNYRVTFGGKEIDYKNDFSACLNYIPIIKKIFKVLDGYDINYKWFFFEPYVEITWIDDAQNHEFILPEIIAILENESIKDYKFSTPANGAFCDWYCNSDKEREFGYKTYSKSAEMALLFNSYNESIELGRGLEGQYVRRAHVLANQLGLNYKREGIYLLKRGILCLLFWFLGHQRAVWVYTKILRFKY